MNAESITKAYINSLSGRTCPEISDLIALCRKLAECMVDADLPEVPWLMQTFDDMGDSLHKAHLCVGNDTGFHPFPPPTYFERLS